MTHSVSLESHSRVRVSLKLQWKHKAGI